MSSDLSRLRDSKAIRLCRKESLKASQEHAKLFGQIPCGSVDIILLICRVILQDYEPLKLSHLPAKFGGNRLCSIKKYNIFNLSHDLLKPYDSENPR